MALRLGLLGMSLVIACAGTPRAHPTPGGDPGSAPAAGTASSASTANALKAGEHSAGERSRLKFELRAGAPVTGQPERVRNVTGTPVPDAEADRLLARLPALPKPAALDATFAKRQAPAPPPTAVDVTLPAFPAAAAAQAPPRAAPQPLEVVRIEPTGEVEHAPELFITFNQPMTALGAHHELVASNLPAVLSPQPEGRWRWIGTRTLAFTPEQRLPMATAYRVQIKKGTRSAAGSSLAADVTHAFVTPPPRLREISVDREHPVGVRPVVVALFDQAVVRDALLAQTQFCWNAICTAARAAAPREIEADERARGLWSLATNERIEARAVAFVPVQSLPLSQRVRVRFGVVPSAEGPRRGRALEAELITHGPLRIVRASCGHDGGCAPGDPFRIELSNRIARDSVELSSLRIEPAAELLGVDAAGKDIYVQAHARGRTKYTITLPASIRDVFGQTLGAPAQQVFDVGDPRPELHYAAPITVLDPRGPRALPVSSIGIDALRVRVHRVQPRDLHAYGQFLMNNRAQTAIPGERVVDRRVAVADVLSGTITAVDVAGALRGGLGHAIVVVEPVQRRTRHDPSLRTWVQSTRLGLDVFQDSTHLYFWVTRLADGTPVAGAKVSIEPGGVHGTTDARGLARLQKPAHAGDRSRVAIAQLGDDVTFLTEQVWGGLGRSYWVARAPVEELRWFVFDDRGVYRPGETVRIKGWLRATSGGPGGTLVLPSGKRVAYTVTSSRGHAIARGSAALNAHGGFDLAFTLPREVDLGHALVAFSTGKDGSEQEHEVAIRIEEFRRPEFEVSLHTSDATHVVGDAIAVRAQARYYTGGGLAGAPARFEVTAVPARFAPPGRDAYAFGEPMPWPFFHGGELEPLYETRRWETRTDGQGNAALEIATSRAEPGYPHALEVSATMEDVNRQAWGAESSLLVHPADTYVGLKLERAFVRLGEPVQLDVIAVDLDGKDAHGRRVEVRGVRRQHVTSGGQVTVREHDVQSCVFSSRGGAHRCVFRPARAGSYELWARVYDGRGRPSDTRLSTWVAGPDDAASRPLERDAVVLLPDRAQYAPGDTAQVLLVAPFWPAEALVLIERAGVLRTESLRLTAGSHILRIPIEEAHAPTLHVRVALNGARAGRTGSAAPEPAYALGRAELDVSLASRRLSVRVEPAAAELEPGSRTRLQASVLDASGKPVAGAEVAVVVVDEAVLALTGHAPGDPLASFYPPVPALVDMMETRSLLYLDEPRTQLRRLGARHRAGGAVKEIQSGLRTMSGQENLFDALGSAASAGGFRGRDGERGYGGGAALPVPRLRAELSPIALFAPALTTRGDGRAVVDFELPDDLTRYRIFALASSGTDRFGRGEGTLTARKPLMVRPSAPRFLHFGDRFELPIVVENQTGSTQSVLVAARASNAAFTSGRGRRVEVPARDRVEVRLPMATRAPGRAALQVAIQAQGGADAAAFELPVWTPATDEAFATYGSLAAERAAAQPIRVPSDVHPEFGGLEISTSSTQVAALTDALLYVDDYPFDCSEQLASRVITLLALRDVLAAFRVEGVPTADEALARVQGDVRRLLALQNDDGGFGWWSRGQESEAYNTLHVLHALVRARAAGVARVERAIDAARRAVPLLLKKGTWPPTVARTMRAYLAYADALAGRDTGAQVEALLREARPSEHGVEALGFMLSAAARAGRRGALVAQLVAALQARAHETAGAAQFTERYDDGAHLLLHSEQRSDAIALEGLMRAAPDHDLAPKLANGLLAHRKRGRWLNTQENVFAALALRAYFDHHERETPSFEARAFLGSVLAQAARYRGRTTEQTTTLVPMAYLSQTDRGPVVVQKLGQGRMYYRLGLRYAPRGLALPPEDQGFEVERSYQAIDDPGDVARDAAGVVYVKAGARVRVRVHMVARARRYHVALVDPLPAGFEPIQSSLRVNVEGRRDEPAACPACVRSTWRSAWYEHQNLRDDRVEAFASLVPAGVFSYEYTARATTPGEFVVPPARAEEMYMPETFGRSASDRVVVR